MPTIKAAAVKARRWLLALQTGVREQPLRDLGICLCDHILCRTNIRVHLKDASLRLPSIDALITLERQALLDLAQSLSMSRVERLPVRNTALFAALLGGMALSFARTNDLAVVAALVRATAHVRLDHPWLVEAQDYLLDQQDLDGAFGFLALECASIGEPQVITGIRLRLTVEILWAFAEAAHQRNNRPQR